MSVETLSKEMLPVVEQELRRAIDRVNEIQGLEELYGMLAYHMGWEGVGVGPEVTGKRIRPLLTLLATTAAGGDWQAALPVAIAIELVHNFSLIHDDIEDNSPLRRGRPTVWKLWGIPQAINAGDAMFTLAHLSTLRLEETCSATIAIQAARILQGTCLHLTQGQYLDISYENRGDVTLESYWEMVSGKTAALLSACTETGALVASASEGIRASYREFGRALGMAFQAQDDLLGIWGDSAQTGKSSESDLLEGKKSLPVLYGLKQGGVFASRWMKGPIEPGEVPDLAAQLTVEGALAYTHEAVLRLTDKALQALEDAHPQGQAGEALFELARKLLNRKV